MVTGCALLMGGAVALAQYPAAVFEYSRSKPLNLTTVGSQTRGVARLTDITFDRITSGRMAATLVAPVGRVQARRPGILFVHWYEPPNPTSNRTEFVEDAVEMAGVGVVSLLVDTMWSDATWFENRDPATDRGHSIEQVKQLRRALDVLASRPGVDPGRLYYVGHDFGAMYGAIVAALDAPRLKGFVFMAGTKAFSDWFLLWPTRADARQRADAIAQTAHLDPPLYLARPERLPMLFQFATQDKFVPRASADAIVAAVRSPREVRWYDAPHALNADATRDRIAWLKRLIGTR
ncbi:MAG: dienelactone hydrolase family protein [Acidobacteriota bacterium]